MDAISILGQALERMSPMNGWHVTAARPVHNSSVAHVWITQARSDGGAAVCCWVLGAGHVARLAEMPAARLRLRAETIARLAVSRASRFKLPEC